MIYAFGPFELDTRVYELRHRGEVCAVEPQVFNVLAYLAEHRDRVVSKEELLEKLWQDRFVSETTLTSRLKAARKAVGDDGKSQSVIRTTHGRGYRFVAPVQIVDAQIVDAAGVDAGSVATPVPAPAASLAESQPAAPPAPASPAASRPAGFVGRDAELARLQRALALACEGQRQIVFVAGEAGAGKTTLVEAFLRRDCTAPIFVSRGQCVEHRGSGEPYMPFFDALGRLCRGARGARAIELLRSEAPSWLLQLPWLLSDEEASVLAARSSSPDRMLRELGMLIERMTEGMPLVLLVEDLHWSDSASIEAIELLARQTHSACLLIIGTFRPSDVKASRHAVLATTQELRARGQCELIELPLLAVREIDDYLRARLPGAGFVRDLASLLHERTSGNPLFLDNLVGSWIARGLIREQEGEWVLDATIDTLATDVPASLQQLIEKRVAELDAEEQRVLETASVIGREFSVALLAATVNADHEDVERRCESPALVGRFIAPAGTEQWGDGTFTSRFAFTHDLYVDVLYDRIPEARRARASPGGTRARARVERTRARARRGAGAAFPACTRPPARDPLSRRGRRAGLAAQCVSRGCAALHGGARSAGGDGVIAGARSHRARDSFTSRAGTHRHTRMGGRGCREELPPRMRSGSRARRARRAFADALRHGHHVRVSRQLHASRTDRPRAAGLRRRRAERCGVARAPGLLDAASGSLRGGHGTWGARNRCRRAEPEAARPRDGRRARVRSRLDSSALVFLGRYDDAIAHGDIAMRLAETRGDELARANALVQAAFVSFYFREKEECRRFSAAAEAVARERRLPFHLSCARTLLGWCLSHDGVYEGALREVRAAIRTSLLVGARMEVPLFLAILAECLARAGDHERALEALDEAFAHVGRSRSFFYVPELYRMSADLLLARGDRDTAHAALKQAQTIAQEQESPLLASRVAESLSRITDQTV